jgi:hypothetical protein
MQEMALAMYCPGLNPACFQQASFRTAQTAMHAATRLIQL